MSKELYLQGGTKFTFNSGNDKGKLFVLLSSLQPCARTEGCYRALNKESNLECYIYPSSLQKFGYTVL